MGDRLYTKTANLISFVAGERVSADKFNAMNSFYSRTFKEISRAIGSVYDAGFPNFSRVGQESYLTSKWNPHQEGNREGRPLDILNLARVIGPASNLNPRFLYRGAKEIEETIPQGISSYTTVYPASALTGTLEGLAFAGGSDLQVASSYRFDSSTSTLFFSEETTQEYTLTYQTDSLSYEGGPNYLYSEFNVIPDPNDTVAKLTITDQGGSTYLIELPIVSAQQAGLNNLADTEIITPDEPNNAVQLKLPYWMTNNMMVPGEIIPENSVYLKNKTTGDTYLSATYKYQSATSLTIEGAELCIDEPNAHDFCLIVVGTDITTSIDDLRTKWFKHKHDGSFGEPRVSVYDLSDRFKHLAPSGVYRASSLGWNYAANYLHRDGYQAEADISNGSNAMRGSIFMGSTTFNGLDNVDIAGTESHSIFFGTTLKYLKAINDDLRINSDQDLLIFAGNNIRADGVNIDLVASGANGGAVNINASETVNINNGENFITNILVKPTEVLISNNASNSNITLNTEGVEISGDEVNLNQSFLLKEVEDLERILPLIQTVENIPAGLWFLDKENINTGCVEKIKIQPFVADWIPTVDFSLPINISEFEDLGNNHYKSLNGEWVSKYPYPYTGELEIYGHGFLDNTNTEITLYDRNPNASYVVNLNKLLPTGEYIEVIDDSEIATVRIERIVNIHRYQKDLASGSLESIESTFYFSIKGSGRNFNASNIGNLITNESVRLKINYEGWVDLTGANEFQLEGNNQDPSLTFVNAGTVFVSLNGNPIDTTDSDEWILGINFVQNKVYKAKETYFNNKVWLEITG